MPASSSSHLVKLIETARSGDTRAAEELLELVYTELRKQAANYLRHENAYHSWDSADLVDEAYLKLVGQDVKWQGRTHFVAIAAQAMRRLLVDHARTKLRGKRGGGRQRIELDEAIKISRRRSEDVLDIDAAIEKLAKLDPEHARIVEMRFFAEMSVQEVANVLGKSKRSIEREWTWIRNWLRRELDEDKRG